MRELTFELEPTPPFRLDLTVWALRRRPDNAIDRWDGQTYRRMLVLGQQPVQMAVTQVTPAEHARLRVTVHPAAPLPNLQLAVTGALERLLGLRIDLAAFYACATADARLGPQAAVLCQPV